MNESLVVEVVVSDSFAHPDNAKVDARRMMAIADWKYFIILFFYFGFCVPLQET
jgi:hypothetical protein